MSGAFTTLVRCFAVLTPAFVCLTVALSPTHIRIRRAKVTDPYKDQVGSASGQ
jgi:hypothetical protein